MSWQHVNGIIAFSKRQKRRLRYTGGRKRGDGSIYVTLPKQWLFKLEWNVGDEVELELQDDAIVIRKASPCHRCEFFATCNERKQYISDIERCIHRRIRMALRA